MIIRCILTEALSHLKVIQRNESACLCEILTTTSSDTHFSVVRKVCDWSKNAKRC